MNKTALVEINESHRPILESTTDGLTLLKGIASEADVKNGNGRSYPLSVMENAVNAAQLKINEGAFNGELDHPEYGFRGKLSSTALRFTKLYMEGKEVKFEAVLLETPQGKTLKALLDGGVKIGMSTRGAGSFKVKDVNGLPEHVVNDDYEMFGIDAVDIPSSANGILQIQESIESKINQERGFTMAEKNIKTVSDLRETYGTLVAEVEAAAKSENEQAAETQVALEGQLATANASVQTLTTELAEAKKSAGVMDEIKKQLLGESMADKVTDDNIVVSKLDSILEQFQTLQESHNTLKTEIARRDERAITEGKLKTLFETEVKNDKNEKILRKYVNPTLFETEEALQAKLNEYREILGEAPTVTASEEGKERGKGEVSESQTGEEKETLSEDMRLQLALSGLEVL